MPKHSSGSAFATFKAYWIIRQFENYVHLVLCIISLMNSLLKEKVYFLFISFTNVCYGQYKQFNSNCLNDVTSDLQRERDADAKKVAEMDILLLKCKIIRLSTFRFILLLTLRQSNRLRVYGLLTTSRE